MKLYVLGTCSGTEPMPDRHHTSFALEVGGRYYWFDAGEGCSYTAHLCGIDLLSVSDIFISHPHMDHVGGLANLLWTIRKLTVVKKRDPRYGDINVYISNEKTFNGTLEVLRQTESYYKNNYETRFVKIEDSVLLDNGDVKVEAMHNEHLKPLYGEWQSFSFRISAEGKRIVYSGDVKSVTELLPYLSDGCDLLLMETGHHTAEEICRYVADSGFAVGRIAFLHHGRAILRDYDGTLSRCREIFPAVDICNDKDIFDFPCNR